MNERDYLLAETMVFTTGVLVTVTVALMFWAYQLPLDIGIIIAVSFVAFMTFFFGLYCHMKRKIYILENEQLINEHRKD